MLFVSIVQALDHFSGKWGPARLDHIIALLLLFVVH